MMGAANKTISRSQLRATVGKKLAGLEKPLPDGVLRKQFCRRFRSIVAEQGIEAVAQATGLSQDYCRKLAAGVRTPDLDAFPALAKALGLSHWTEWFDAPKK